MIFGRKLSTNAKMLISVAIMVIIGAICLTITIVQAVNSDPDDIQVRQEVRGYNPLKIIGKVIVGHDAYFIVCDVDTGVMYYRTEYGLYPLYNIDGSLRVNYSGGVDG